VFLSLSERINPPDDNTHKVAGEQIEQTLVTPETDYACNADNFK
jgi:hypothetical protein